MESLLEAVTIKGGQARIGSCVLGGSSTLKQRLPTPGLTHVSYLIIPGTEHLSKRNSPG